MSGELLRAAGTRRLVALVAMVWGLLALGWLVLPATGLRGEYFANLSWTAPAVHTRLDASLTTLQLSRSWDYLPPDQFTARWTGYLHAARAGDYTFSLEADDRATLAIDRQVVIQIGRAHV